MFTFQIDGSQTLKTFWVFKLTRDLFSFYKYLYPNQRDRGSFPKQEAFHRNVPRKERGRFLSMYPPVYPNMEGLMRR
jgi:hypothetical protein